MPSSFLLLAIVFLTWSGVACRSDRQEALPEKDIPPQTDSKPSDVFFAKLTALCGKGFWGSFVHPGQPPFPFAGSELLMEVASCDDQRIRITFHVGEDASRNWVLAFEENRLRLTHDHRNRDGSAADVTGYGGVAVDLGSAWRQDFPADAATIEQIPKAADSVWSMIFSEDMSKFSYLLTKSGEVIFHVDFSLSSSET